MAQARCSRRSTLAPPAGIAARALATLVVLAALFTARGAAAAERLPWLRGATAVRLSTCRLALDAQDGDAKPPPANGSSILDVEPLPPALVLPRARSGPDGKPGADDAVAGADGLVILSNAPARRFDPASATRTAPLGTAAPASRYLAARLARGPPSSRS